MGALGQPDHGRAPGLVHLPHLVSPSPCCVYHSGGLDGVCAVFEGVAYDRPSDGVPVLDEGDHGSVIDGSAAVEHAILDGLQRPARIVHDAVVVHDSARQAAVFESRPQLQRLRPVDEPMAPGISRARHHLVQPHRNLHLGGRVAAPAIRRYEDGDWLDEAVVQIEMQIALVARLPGAAKTEVMQVAQAAVHQLRAASAGPRTEVVGLHEADRHVPQCGVPEDGCAGYPAPQDQHVQRLRGHPGEQTASCPSAEVSHGGRAIHPWPMSFRTGSASCDPEAFLDR